MKNKQKRKTHRWIWFVHEISSTMNSPWMQNKKISVQCFFCVSNGRSSSTRRAHSPPRGKPFNKNKGGEGAGGGGVWINQIHVTTMALDSSGLLFFLKWRNHSWKFRSLNTHTHKKKHNGSGAVHGQRPWIIFAGKIQSLGSPRTKIHAARSADAETKAVTNPVSSLKMENKQSLSWCQQFQIDPNRNLQRGNSVNAASDRWPISQWWNDCNLLNWPWACATPWAQLNRKVCPYLEWILLVTGIGWIAFQHRSRRKSDRAEWTPRRGPNGMF